jgi:hypothetical protein
MDDIVAAAAAADVGENEKAMISWKSQRGNQFGLGWGEFFVPDDDDDGQYYHYYDNFGDDQFYYHYYDDDDDDDARNNGDDDDEGNDDDDISEAVEDEEGIIVWIEEKWRPSFASQTSCSSRYLSMHLVLLPMLYLSKGCVRNSTEYSGPMGSMVTFGIGIYCLGDIKILIFLTIK